MSLNVEKIINEVTRVVDGLTGELDGYDLTPKQFDFLLIQASKVEELERQNKRYREALEFYAEQDNYEWETTYRPQQEIDCMVIDDGGHTARKALEDENE